jgi:hypothetical protein
MISLKHFLAETASEEKLKHLEHAEDHIMNAGMEGFAHAFHNLEDTHDQLQGKKNKTTIMTKYDGSPSIVFGHHPETGRFFVASKSAFNVNPKLNYTPSDVDKNHGHAPGLAEKLKHALKHLPKIMPDKGVYQGDLMHSGVKTKNNPEGDIVNKDSKYHFTPNVIKYSTPHSSAEGKKIAKSKLGVVVHTAYKGKNFANLKADYSPDLSHFNEHPDVHMIDNRNDVPSAKLTHDQHQTYTHHLEQAKQLFTSTPKEAYNVMSGEHAEHADHLKTYINKTVRESSTPSVSGYQEHLKDLHTKAIAKVKTQKAVQQKMDLMNQHLEHVEKNKPHFNAILQMHHHMQAAKDQLVHALSANPKFEHSINDAKSKPEGYVVVRNNRPTKLVDRADFSRQNFLARPR